MKRFKIAVSGKGGVGKTTVSSVLARGLSRDGYSVLAIDSDPDMNLARSLGISESKEPPPLSTLKALIEERAGGEYGTFKLNPKVDDVIESYSVIGPDGIRLVNMGTVEKGGSGCMCPDTAFLKAVIRYALFKEQVVIFDTDAGIEHLGRGLAKDVDLLLVVIEPGKRSIETLKRIIKLSKDIGIERIAAVLNKRFEGLEIDPDSVEVPIIGTIPFDKALIAGDLNGQASIEIDSDAIREILKIKDQVVQMMT